MEQLVLEQFGAEPPFGGSTFLPATFLNTPFVGQNGGVNPNPFTGILSPPPGTPRTGPVSVPCLLYGEFQPNMRTQYTAQYNLTIQRELAQRHRAATGLCRSQGHRLLASHDINAANPQTCLGHHRTRQYRSDMGDRCSALNAAASSPRTIRSSSVRPLLRQADSSSLQRQRRRSNRHSRPEPRSVPSLRTESSCRPASLLFAQLQSADRRGTVARRTAFRSSATSSPKTRSPPRLTTHSRPAGKALLAWLAVQAAYTFSKSSTGRPALKRPQSVQLRSQPRAVALQFEAPFRNQLLTGNFPFRKYSGVAGKVLNDWSSPASSVPERISRSASRRRTTTS